MTDIDTLDLVPSRIRLSAFDKEPPISIHRLKAKLEKHGGVLFHAD